MNINIKIIIISDNMNFNIISISIQNDINFKGNIGTSIIKIYNNFLNIPIYIHINMIITFSTNMNIYLENF